jgi:D-sedoheptulose 7-phosphate isomerase
MKNKNTLLSYADIGTIYKDLMNSKNYKKFKSLVLEKIIKKKTIFICGNGGSAANANHAAVDISNQIRLKNKRLAKCISLSSNIPMITALANDYGYQNIFSMQLESLGHKGDLLIVFSVSGSSPNIIRVLDKAKKIGIETLSISGFKGGKIKNKSNISLNFNSKNYGLIEDLQMLIIHNICQSKFY